MILGIEELDSHPTGPAQWDRYYNRLDDLIYIQVLPTTDGSYPSWVEMSKGAAVREDMRIIGTLTRSKYSAKDFQTYKDQLVAWIALKYGDSFNDFMSSEPAIMIIEYISAALDQMSWYLDREADEWYPSLSRLLSSVVQLSRYLGYKAAPAVSASTDLEATLPSGPYAFDVPLKKGHQFQGPSDLVFELDSDQVIPAGEGTPSTPKTLTIYQGRSFTQTFISTGKAKQVFNLSLVPADRYIAQGKNICTVDGVEWDEEEFLPYVDDEAYEINYLDNPPKLRFGDGIIGSIPPTDSEIKITYIATSGKAGQLAISGSIEDSITPVVVNFQQIPLSVTNPNGASAGANPETIASINTNAPKWFETADRAVTKGDTETLAQKFSDPLYGSVEKANVFSIRGIEDDLELQALLTALRDNADNLNAYLDAVIVKQNSIKGFTGAIATSGTIRYVLEQIRSQNVLTKAKTNEMDTLVGTVQGNVADAESDIDTAKSRLDFLSFHENLGFGNGSTTSFGKVLAYGPVREGSVTVVVGSQTATKSAADGDCDTTPGEVAATIAFVTGDEGKLIRIGGEYRQILKRVSATNVQYTGPRIYGTSLIVEVFPPSVVAYDDGAGGFTGSGISGGSINYVSSSISGLTFNVAPAGLSGQYGVPVVCTYQYKGEGIKTILDNAKADCDLADTNVQIFSTYGDEVDGYADAIDVHADEVSNGTDGLCEDIDTSADVSIALVNDALLVPVQLSNDIDAIEAYLEEVLSGNCKANIIRVSFLVKDVNGFYVGPSLSLRTALKAYLDARRIETVRLSVISGSFYLLNTNLAIRFKVSDQYVYSDVESRLLAAFDTMFKDRDYGEGLTRKEYYEVANAIVGHDYINIEIGDRAWADTSNLEIPPAPDADGNLFVAKNVVITKGVVTTSEIT